MGVARLKFCGENCKIAKFVKIFSLEISRYIYGIIIRCLLTREVDGSWNDASLFQLLRFSHIKQLQLLSFHQLHKLVRVNVVPLKTRLLFFIITAISRGQRSNGRWCWNRNPSPSILCYVMKFEEIRRQAALSSPMASQTRVCSRIAALCRWGGSLHEATATSFSGPSSGSGALRSRDSSRRE